MSTGNPCTATPTTSASPRITQALLSVSDKTGMVDFARGLSELGISILSTGGTYSQLQHSGVSTTDVARYTGFPEMMAGRVKTLHPKIFAGILARRDVADDQTTMLQHGIEGIDLVVVNLYPFQHTVAQPDTTVEEAIEQIDIGGPSLVRAAAKNHAFVTVVTSPSQYARVLDEIRQRGGTSADTRRLLATQAFQHTADYDAAIASYLARQSSHESAGQADPFPECFRPTYFHLAPLRYGENPHQRAAVYRQREPVACSIVNATFLHGKELSYNNYLDLDAALQIVRGFVQPAAAVIKHNNPCGVATGPTMAEALRKAMEADPASAFGSILGLNREVDEATAELLATPGWFVEAIVATDYRPAAMRILTSKPKWKSGVRLLSLPQMPAPAAEIVCRPIMGGALLQDSDCEMPPTTGWQLVTRLEPPASLVAELEFAWAVVRHVRSNAIVLTKQHATVGVGAGQMSRVDAVEIAIRKARERARGAALASDAFFPFPDSIQLASRAGVAAVVQPGGSKRDADVIAACNELGLPMFFTGRRHFKH
jgi:phosphoribosylaminoimidazolecarboxamide formyltransferase/IMP cyclohydrolase